MKTALVVKSNGEMYEIDIEKNEYEMIRSEINGWLQAIDLQAKFKASMWIDEEGKLKSLPHNLYVQRIFDEEFGAWRDSVVGDVVFTGLPDRSGNTTGLTQEMIASLREKVYEVQDFFEPRFEIIEIQEV